VQELIFSRILSAVLRSWSESYKKQDEEVQAIRGVPSAGQEKSVAIKYLR
jgi:hypothetical protein